jgi:drug/metabolite transporter (DMT)-like permease
LYTAASALWAALYLVPYKAAGGQANASAIALPMLLCAAGINSMISIVRGDLPRPHWRPTTAIVVLLLAGLSALGNEAMAQALAAIGPGVAAVLLRTQVVFVALGGMLLLGERTGGRFWVGALLALVGFALLQNSLERHAQPVLGMAWGLVAAFAFGAMQIVLRKTARVIDLVGVNGMRLWLAAGLLACLPGRIPTLFEIAPRVWLLCAAAALCGPVISRLLLMAALRYIPAALCTMVQFLAPVFAFVLGGVVFGTWPNALQLFGCVLILLGIGFPLTHRFPATASR